MTATTMVALAFIAVQGLLLVVMIFGSLTWALVTCQRCGAKVPMFQWPTSASQLLRGGWTCPVCGYQVDKWGRPI
jgi:hypothetical protein